ncbi:MAG TPA: hypothetical protein VFO52_02415 [Longimicrobiales bacterium]|nr:hypothetical protein [Longimicrobiales bacterium]
MKRFIAVAGIALFASACAGDTDPYGLDLQYTIDLPGNDVGTPGCQSIDLSSCFAVLDHQFKLLYETNSTAARRGEADYQVVSSANRKLASIFVAETRTVAQAMRALDQFSAMVEGARDRGRYSRCWGDYVLAYAGWLRSKVTAGDLNVDDAPQMTCFVSPVAGVTGAGTTADGVTLRIADPWHFSGDPYGTYTTRTWFVVTGPSGTIATPPAMQTGADVVTIADPATTIAGVYEYSVTQCADWGRCSDAVRVIVTVR